ncbi:hypothetical protein PACTADRAFT_3041 [Pachysolen tannophilus NRRL Y-2460]|uniref:Malate synthase n=1 Tax=Pachysolen tannophilus NRRL Y-2460 TaxID=669874 RepID=A0A1E4TUE4_PACTA|nr:hypothetical protein PACTADRAFT_3041 [Pachysolen tannophilus NRRL Y-2460]
MSGSINPFPQKQDILNDVQIKGSIPPEIKERIFTADALAFIATLHRSFGKKRLELLENRHLEQVKRDTEGKLPNFLPETAYIREDKTWVGAPLAKGLVDRRVEITGPTDRKMVINALNSKVAVYMADFEDSLTPSWANLIDGQFNLYDAVRREINLKTSRKNYELNLTPGRHIPTLIVRPRGWHLNESHVIVDGEPISGSMFDFGLYFYHNAKEALAQGFGPYFYLPKMEHHLEAKLWNDIFEFSQDYIGIPRGTIRATVLIETIPAVFQMDEIIYQLRNHIAGLNCGRWDYLFSYIKCLRSNPNFILPDRAQVNMTVPFMANYVKLLIKTCHARKVHAMGGMAALIPIKNDPVANEKAMNSVKSDKLREVVAGHDGTWIAHPALADIALDIFNKHMPGPNQINVFRPEYENLSISNFDLLTPYIPGFKITEGGIRINIRVGLIYLGNWIGGLGCSPINYLMEDAATAEVSRAQLNQWVKHNAKTEDGKVIDKNYVSQLFKEESNKLLNEISDYQVKKDYKKAIEFYKPDVLNENFDEFLTFKLYDEVTRRDVSRSVSAQKL